MRTALQAAKRYWASEEWRELRRLLPAVAGKALDVGAGRGIASYALARDGWAVHALEPDSSMLVGAGAIRQIAAETGYPIEVVEAFGEQLPFEAGHFDAVLARQALHHARDLPALLRELYRDACDPAAGWWPSENTSSVAMPTCPDFSTCTRLHKLYEAHGENAYLLEEYTTAIRSAGFTLQAVISAV